MFLLLDIKYKLMSAILIRFLNGLLLKHSTLLIKRSELLSGIKQSLKEHKERNLLINALAGTYTLFYLKWNNKNSLN
jgi:hypothetical protein